MQDLRLIGVHEDGLHLLLADDEGNRYTVPLDESLRAAARRDRPRLGQLQIEIAGGLRPKDVQAMIRAGLTAEEVAERAGWTVEKVHRYEGPILAEREHVAGLARQVRLRPRGGSHGGAPDPRGAGHRAPAHPRDRPRRARVGLPAHRQGRLDRAAPLRRRRPRARGRLAFDPLARTVSALDDESRWLSEDEDHQAPGPLPAPHLATSTRPAASTTSRPRAAWARRRRGAARARPSTSWRPCASGAPAWTSAPPESTEVPGLDEAPEEACPLEEVARDPRDELPPPAHTHPEDDPEVVKTGTVEERVGAEAAQRQVRRTSPPSRCARCPATRPRPIPRPVESAASLRRAGGARRG